MFIVEPSKVDFIYMCIFWGKFLYPRHHARWIYTSYLSLYQSYMSGTVVTVFCIQENGSFEGLNFCLRS